MELPSFLASEPANVGLFNDSFPPVMDGVAVCVENYARWMQQKVGGVYVVAPEVPGTDYSTRDYKVLDYLSLPLISRDPYRTGIPEVDPTFLARIAKLRFKIVHAHCPFATGLAALRISRLQKIPLVATFHSKYRDNFSRILPDLAVDVIIRRIVEFYEQADLVWVPQDSVVDVLREYGYNGPVEVMDNGCDFVSDYPDAFFTEARARLGVAAEEFVLLYVGQHIWEKNTRLIIESLARLKDLPFRMFFVGTGYAEQQMKEMVTERGLDDRVCFVGAITDRDRLRDYYAASDLFLFPSLYDTAGIVVREAAALNSPSVMAREATASTCLTDGQTGFLTDNDPDRMAALLRSLMLDPERVHRVGRQAARRIVRSWDDVVEEVLDRYNVLLRSRGLPLIER